jgi:hypothetical protein
MDYFGICTFGWAQVLGPLTKKFAVFGALAAVPSSAAQSNATQS